MDSAYSNVRRTRYPRYGLQARKRSRGDNETNTGETIGRQVITCLILLILVGLIKNADFSAAKTIKSGIKSLMTHNIEFDSLFKRVDAFLSSSGKDIPSGGKDNSAIGKDNSVSGKDDAVPVFNSSDKDGKSENTTGQQDTAVQQDTGAPKIITDQQDNGSQQDTTADKGAVTQQDTGNSPEGGLADSEGGLTGDEAVTNNGNEGLVKTDAVSREKIEEVKRKYKFILPVNGMVSSPYGLRPDPFSGEEKMHKGIDIEAAKGTSIKAVLSGEVTETGNGRSFGKYIKIKKDNITVVYAHCSQLLAKKGQKIKQGSVVAKVGNTGYSLGAHLHIEIWIDSKPVDPEEFLKIQD